MECLVRWFIRASDHQAELAPTSYSHPYPDPNPNPNPNPIPIPDPNQVAMVGAGADSPASLVYRIGGVTLTLP